MSECACVGGCGCFPSFSPRSEEVVTVVLLSCCCRPSGGVGDPPHTPLRAQTPGACFVILLFPLVHGRVPAFSLLLSPRAPPPLPDPFSSSFARSALMPSRGPSPPFPHHPAKALYGHGSSCIAPSPSRPRFPLGSFSGRAAALGCTSRGRRPTPRREVVECRVRGGGGTRGGREARAGDECGCREIAAASSRAGAPRTRAGGGVRATIASTTPFPPPSPLSDALCLSLSSVQHCLARSVHCEVPPRHPAIPRLFPISFMA